MAPDPEAHGTEKVNEAVHKSSGRIEPAVVPVKLAAGGSVGKEGPCAQIGAGLASRFADLLRFSDSNRRRLVICGISAGFASVFGTPIVGAIFGVEALFMGSILYDVLLRSFIAGITAYEVSSSLGIRYFHHSIDFVPVFSESFFVKILLSGIFFGLCSLLLIESLRYGENLAGRIHIWKPLKGIVGGAALIALTLILSQDYLGLGIAQIESALSGHAVPWYAFASKIIFTSVTLSFGGSGGDRRTDLLCRIGFRLPLREPPWPGSRDLRRNRDGGVARRSREYSDRCQHHGGRTVRTYDSALFVCGMHCKFSDNRPPERVPVPDTFREKVTGASR